MEQLTPQKRNKYIKYALLLLLLLLLGGGYSYINHLKNQISGNKSTIEALSNDITKHIAKDGTETAEKNLILSSYKDLKAIHAADSSTIGKLKKLVSKNTISATIVSNVTKGSANGKTEIIFKDKTLALDTSKHQSTIPCDTVYPEYKTDIKDKWTDINVVATKDSTHVDYKLFNEYEIKQEIKKTGTWPFRKKTPMISVHNLNPHTETTKIASYAVQVPKQGKKIAIISGLSALAGFIGAIILIK